jgi:hypothetical protein
VKVSISGQFITLILGISSYVSMPIYLVFSIKPVYSLLKTNQVVLQFVIITLTLPSY